MIEHFYYLYIGDVDEEEVVNWLTEHLRPVVFTTRTDFASSNMYHGGNDLWILDTTDVSDASVIYDTITQIRFKHQNDLLLCKLTWGGREG